MDKRAALLEAAADTFAKKGFYNAKIEEIAAAAGMGKGTVYEYFSSKKHLFQEVIKHSFETYLDLVEQEIGRWDDPVKKLEAILNVHMKFINMHRGLAKVVANDPGSISEDTKMWVLGFRRRAMARIQTVIEEGIKTGCFRNSNPDIACQMFLGSMGIVFGSYIFDMGRLPMEKVPGIVLDIFLNGIRD